MSDAAHIRNEAETRARSGGFAWTEKNAARVKAILLCYPDPEEARLG